jgi:hypothetical protein
MSDLHGYVSKSAGGYGAPAMPERFVYSEAPIDGTFTNPVVAGFHPDPSICRVGPDYYLACSSFEYFPGVPIFHSRDLARWEQIGNALERPGQLSLPASVPSSGGVYAPTLRYHDDRVWLITTDVSGGGTVLFTAADPAGPALRPASRTAGDVRAGRSGALERSRRLGPCCPQSPGRRNIRRSGGEWLGRRLPTTARRSGHRVLPVHNGAAPKLPVNSALRS